ncbi:FAD-dependent oxidoreductase [Falsiroseomonas sp. HW251]|uniref:FAD-dependent oxidoreductase n=1 Tax=Falsiroseomonas sp. HW251 TaxID=3390998 RepID=UPI003D324176
MTPAFGFAPGETEASCDLLVLGSGAAGLTAAVTAAEHGLDVIVAEKDSLFGGISAWSGGWLWIPGNRFAAEAGITDSAEEAGRYLRHELGNHFDTARVDAFLQGGPAMLEFLEGRTALRFESGVAFPDYHPGVPGAVQGGRSLRPATYDGRALGEAVHALRPPMRELTLFGLGVSSGGDIRHFAQVTRSLSSALFVLKRIAAHARDRLLHGRDLRLVNGNALVGMLLRSALDRGVRLRLSAAGERLLPEEGRVAGAVLATPVGPVTVRARRGVVLATGGFGHDPARQASQHAHVARGGTHLPVAPAAVAGDGLRLGEAAGGRVVQGLPAAAILAPVSRVPHGDGSAGIYPHFVDRGKPGVIAVTRDGRRFVNESNSYHDMVQGMLRACGDNEATAFLIADARAVRRYGLGYAKPAPLSHEGLVRAGYLRRAATPAALAAEIGIEPVALEETIRAFNAAAAEGRDPAFGRGDNRYNHFQGDPEHEPNPCLAPLETPPFYAVQVFPGDLGTAAGLRTDAAARVLDEAGMPIRGLYAAGNDMATVMAGCAPGGGVTLAPAMVFGWIAARHAAGAGGDA